MQETEKNFASHSPGGASGASHDSAREPDSWAVSSSAINAPALERIRRWVVHNPLAAVLGVFTLGVFIGVMKHD